MSFSLFALGLYIHVSKKNVLADKNLGIVGGKCRLSDCSVAVEQYRLPLNV